MISFAAGRPAPECLDRRAARRLRARGARARRATILSYGAGGGYGPLREWLGGRHGVAPGRVVLTTGGLQGFVFYAAELLAQAAGPRARRGADLRPAAQDARAEGRRGRRAADGRRRARPRRARAGARPRRRRVVPLHDPDLPEPERPDALGRAAAAARRAGGRRTACRCSRTTRTASSATRARRRRPCTSSRAAQRVTLHVVVLEDGRARPARRLVRAAGGARARGSRSAPCRRTSRRRSCRRRPCTSSSRAARSSRTSSGSAACCGARRDAMLDALERELAGAGDAGAGPRAATSSGSSCRRPTRPSCSSARERGGRHVRQAAPTSSRRRAAARASARLAFSYESPRQIAEGVSRWPRSWPACVARCGR